MAVCEPLIFPVSSVKEVARHPYSTRDCFILLIFQSKTAHCGFLARQAWQTSLAGGKYSGLSSTSSGRGYLFFTQKGKNYVIAWRKAYPFQGGGGGCCSPPIFLEQQEKICAKPVFNYVFMFFIYYYYYYIFFYFSCFFFSFLFLFYYFSCFLNFNLPEVGVIFQLHSHQTVVA